VEKIDINKIIDLFKEALYNKYFLYMLMIIFVLITVSSIKDYKLYKLDCAILQQRPKPIGFIINSFVNLIGLSIITSIGFSGYYAYKNGYTKNKPILEITETKKPQQTKYKITKTIKKEIPRKTNFTYKLNKVDPNKEKIKKLENQNKYLSASLKKERAKRKLNEELLKAIQDVN